MGLERLAKWVQPFTTNYPLGSAAGAVGVGGAGGGAFQQLIGAAGGYLGEKERTKQAKSAAAIAASEAERARSEAALARPAPIGPPMPFASEAAAPNPLVLPVLLAGGVLVAVLLLRR